jgi:hypothetical protein
MKLLVDWGVGSPRLDRLLLAGCSHCNSPVGRLVRHDARAGGEQIWLACCGCNARLRGGPLAHMEHPRRSSYLLWSEDLGEKLTREELAETILAVKPVTLTELLREILRRRVLAHVHCEFSASGYVVGCGIAERDLAELAPVVGVGKYAALEFEDGAARLLRFEKDLVRILTPHRKGDRIDLSDRTTLQITRRSPSHDHGVPQPWASMSNGRSFHS